MTLPSFFLTRLQHMIGPVCAAALLAACGGGGGGAAPAPVAAATFGVGGTVAGLAGGATLKLTLNSGAALPIGASGSFRFPATFAAGTSYAVAIDTQPVGQTCTVTNGSGLLTADIVNVGVACVAIPPVVTLATISGTIAGMGAGGTLTLANQGIALATYGGNDAFNFSNLQGAAYALSVAHNPAGQLCTVTGGAGIATAATTPVAVACRDAQVTILTGSSGGAGYSDGLGNNARLNRPMGMAMDRAGNLFVADRGNYSIRKITPAGTVTTFAGSAAQAGTVDGAGTNARFWGPKGIAIDASDNLYVTDAYANSVRKITPAGVVTTLGELPGIVGGYPSIAGIAVDSTGSLYVIDPGLGTIRKRSAAGVVTTFAGLHAVCGADDGSASDAIRCTPNGLALDTAGNLYIVDSGEQRVRKITPAGVASTIAGGTTVFGFSTGTDNDERRPSLSGIVVDAQGNVLVSDYHHDRIAQIAPDGTVSTVVGGILGYRDGAQATARLRTPTGLVLAPNGDVFVAEEYNYTVRKLSSKLVTTLAGKSFYSGSTDGPPNVASFYGTGAMAVDAAGNVFVADSSNSVIRKVTPDGVVSTFAGTAGSGGTVDGTGAAARFDVPQAIAIDRAGILYVATFYSVRKITPDGVVTTLAGSRTEGGMVDGVGSAARFNIPQSIAVDDNGNVFTADFGRALRKITPNGTVTTVAFSGCSYKDGLNGQFCALNGLVTDHAGNVYFGDTQYGNVRKLAPDGVMSTFAGNTAMLGEMRGNVDGPGSQARFGGASGLAMDSAGNIYLADSGNCTVRQITPAGVVSTVLGTAGVCEAQEGPVPGRIGVPSNMAVGPDDQLYMWFNGGILKVKVR